MWCAPTVDEREKWPISMRHIAQEGRCFVVSACQIQPSPREALVFAWALGIVAIALLWFGANPLTGLLGVGAILLYVVFYTLILKRRTTQNIVCGGRRTTHGWCLT